MFLERIPVGPLNVNCYIVGECEGGEAVIIDPGGNSEIILNTVSKYNLKIKYIINTHCHFDHVGAIMEVRDNTGASFLIHEDGNKMLSSAKHSAKMFMNIDIEDPPPADSYLGDGDIINFGTLKFQIIHTPGHSPDGICLLSAESIFTGDTLFSRAIGRTDLPWSNYDVLIESITSKLLPLNDDLQVYPGHGKSTTIGIERKFNPFLKNN